MGMTEAQGQMRRHVQREPGAAEVRSRQPERSLGRRHHLRQDCAWVGVPCRSRVIDRGVQYSSMGYRTMLSENGITPSMSAPAAPTTTPARNASSQASRRSWPTGATSRTSKTCGRPFSGTSSCSTTGNGSIVRWDT